jgi:dihydroorotate dehydrogenase electron transfer subunit
MAKRIEDFTVQENKRLNNDLFILELMAGNGGLPELKPGQFAEVRIDKSPATFLRRPLSLHDVDYRRNTIKFLIQIAGDGTESLSRLRRGETVNLIYPLGNSFTLPSPGENVLLIGGGCGTAPLLFLAKYMRENGFKPEILLGFRNSNRIIEMDEFLSIGPIYLTTEDGSNGEKGFVTDHSILAERQFNRIYCCGPHAMMKAVASYCSKKDIHCEISLENLMACGIGVCLCCIVETKDGNLCTCTDGPVFNIKKLMW